jgi:hypothetical protein
MANGKSSFSVLMAAGMLLATGPFESAWAQTAPPMGTARSFGVLGASTVTSTGPTSVTGDLGVSPGTAITGFPPGTVSGTTHAADAVAAQAQADAATAYNFLAAETCGTNLTGQDLGGMTLAPGVYCFNTSAQLTGTLNLNAGGDPNAIFVFQTGTTFVTSPNSAVIVAGGSPCGVFFQVGSSATLSSGTQFAGNIFALASVTANTGASMTGGSYALNGAVTMDSNAAAACQGTLQVCKVAGAGVVEGTNFAFSIAGNPVVIPAGAAPTGSCSDALVVPAVPAVITEILPPGTTLASVTTLPGAGLLISSDLAAGTATVQVTAGGQTVATFVDTVPPPPTTGFLQICKIAGNGVALGTNFTFNVAGTPITVAAGPPLPESCSAALTVPAGQVPIAEILPIGTTMTSVSTLPSPDLLFTSDLAAGTATVTVIAGAQTMVTFTDAVTPTTGFLQICKIAGAGIVAGTNFTFSVAGTPLTVPAGPGPAGSCGEAVVSPAGPVLVTETLPLGIQLTAVGAAPEGLLVSSDLPAGQATVTVNAGGTTVVTFQNARIPVPLTGFVQICEVGGAGVVPGTNFVFMVAGTPVTVPAGPAPGGACSAPFVEPAGPLVITEALLSGTVLTAVATLPPGMLVASNLAADTATIMVANGGQTIVTFLNANSTDPGMGFLQICKAAGAGVTVGTNFEFRVRGTLISVAAGPAPGGNCSPPLAEPAGPVIILETQPPTTTVTSITSVPAGSLISSNLPTGTAVVGVTAGGQTITTYIDAIVPVLPGTGFLQVCKIAGAGIAVGTPVTFSVAGNPVSVLAGPAPGGSCSTPLLVPAGATLIAESPLPGAVMSSVTTSPGGLLVSSNLAAGTATVTVIAGGQTTATFLNAAVSDTALGTVEVCKLSGSGVTAGMRFSFSVGGTPVTVAAGSCVTAATFPVGTVIIVGENPSAGTLVSAIGVLPPERQGPVDLSGGTVSVTVGSGLTEVDFTNSAGGLGLLKVCKVAGSGITPGSRFSFVIGGTSFAVPAGSCFESGLFPVGTVVTISEAFSPSAVVSAISVLPPDRRGIVDLNAQTVTATVGVGVTEVNFTNVSR